MRALSQMWSEADLAFNRRGEVSPAQRRVLRFRYAVLLALCIGLPTALIAAAFELHATGVIVWETPAGDAVDGLAGCLPFFALWPIWRYTRFLLDLHRGVVMRMSGRCDFKEDEHQIARHRVVPAAPIDDLFVEEVHGYLLPRTKLVIAIEKQ